MPINAPWRNKWIYLTDYPNDNPSGLRCWLEDFRADVAFCEGKWSWFVVACFGKIEHSYWAFGESETVFLAMRDAEKKLAEIVMNFDEEHGEGDDDERS